MYYKNLKIFRCVQKFPYTGEQLAERLQEKIAVPCHKNAKQSLGWQSPFGRENEILVHSCGGFLFFSACKEEKILPASVIKEQLDLRIKDIEAQESRTLYHKERLRLKDDVIFDLLARAFTRRTVVFAHYDPNLNCLLVNTASDGRAEELTILLRETLGRLEILPVSTNREPNTMLTTWLSQHNASSDFELDDFCELADIREDRGIIKCDRQDLGAQEVQAHLKAGKQVTSLGLIWKEKISFILDADFSIRRIRYLDLIDEQRQDIHAESAEQQLDADFTLMSGELTQLLSDLFAALGGLVDMEKPRVAKVAADAAV